MKRRIAAVLLLFSCTKAAPSVDREAPAFKTPGPNPNAEAVERTRTAVDLGLCFRLVDYDASTAVHERMKRHVLEALGRQGIEHVRGAAGPCETSANPALHGLIGCFGAPGRLACRVDDLALLARSIAFQWAFVQRHPAQATARWRTKGAFVPGDAAMGLLRLRQSGVNPRQVRALIDWLTADLGIRSADVGALVQVAETKDIDLTPEAHSSFQLALAYLLGHEAYHIFDDSCTWKEPAATETNGLFNFAVRSQTSRQLICPEAAQRAELIADKCGLRSIHNLRTLLLQEHPRGVQRQISIVAADTLGWALTSRFAEYIPDDENAWYMKRTSGYLHPVLRVMTVSEEILSEAGTVSGRIRRPMCDRLARNTVIALQKELQRCYDDVRGEVDDILLDRLPKTVKSAWAGGQWSDSSFWCPSK